MLPGNITLLTQSHFAALHPQVTYLVKFMLVREEGYICLNHFVNGSPINVAKTFSPTGCALTFCLLSVCAVDLPAIPQLSKHY